jgi:hypothetical protein
MRRRLRRFFDPRCGLPLGAIALELQGTGLLCVTARTPLQNRHNPESLLKRKTKASATSQLTVGKIIEQASGLTRSALSNGPGAH